MSARKKKYKELSQDLLGYIESASSTLRFSS